MLPAHNALIEQMLAARAGDAARGAAASGTARHAIVAGSDAHTLRRVGRTWTEAPGATRDEFLSNIAAGLGRAHGQQGGTLPLAADIYGVIIDYWVSLIGLRRQELSVPRRAFGLAFSIVSAPFEFIPLLVATIAKSGESRRVQLYTELLAAAGLLAAAAGQPGDPAEPVSFLPPSPRDSGERVGVRGATR
jgi:hypothetical protein